MTFAISNFEFVTSSLIISASVLDSHFLLKQFFSGFLSMKFDLAASFWEVFQLCNCRLFQHYQYYYLFFNFSLFIFIFSHIYFTSIFSFNDSLRSSDWRIFEKEYHNLIPLQQYSYYWSFLTFLFSFLFDSSNICWQLLKTKTHKLQEYGRD